MRHNEEDAEFKMNKTQFDLATKGSRLSKKNLMIAYKVLVENIPRTEVLKSEGSHKQSLSRVINTVESRLSAILEKNNLTVIELIVSKDQVKEAEENERILVSKISGK